MAEKSHTTSLNNCFYISKALILCDILNFGAIVRIITLSRSPEASLGHSHLPSGQCWPKPSVQGKLKRLCCNPVWRSLAPGFAAVAGKMTDFCSVGLRG